MHQLGDLVQLQKYTLQEKLFIHFSKMDRLQDPYVLWTTGRGIIIEIKYTNFEKDKIRIFTDEASGWCYADYVDYIKDL